MANKTVENTIYEIFTYLILIVLSIITILPLYWLLSCTFKTPEEAIGFPPSLFPRNPTLGNFLRLLDNQTFSFNSYSHSIIISLGTMLLSVFIATLAGYGLSRYKFPGGAGIEITIMCFQMIPILAIIIPLYQSYSFYGLYNTHTGLILIYAAQTAPMNTWILKGYFDTIPKAIEESAMIDGLSKTMSFFKIALPIAAPGISAAAIFAFFRAWNEYIVAMTLTSSNRPYTVELYRFIGDQGDVDWALLGTASFIAIVPIFIMFSFAQKYFVIGLSGGAIKS